MVIFLREMSEPDGPAGWTSMSAGVGTVVRVARAWAAEVLRGCAVLVVARLVTSTTREMRNE